MKHQTELKFNPLLENKEKWLADNKLVENSLQKNLWSNSEEVLNEELRFLIEVKAKTLIWHSEEEIINHLKSLKALELKENIESKVEEKKLIKSKKKNPRFKNGSVVRKKRKLLKKELLKDANGLDHLVLTFNGIEKKFVIFPRSFKGRWDELIIGRNYQITYFYDESDVNPNHDKLILVGFKKIDLPTHLEKENKAWKTEAKLLVKEQLKNSEDKDYLLLKFENIKKDIFVYQNKIGKDKWDELIINENYKLNIVKRNEVDKKDFLTRFKKDLKILKI